MRRQLHLRHRQIHLRYPFFQLRKGRAVIAQQQAVGALIYHDGSLRAQEFLACFRQFAGIGVLQVNAAVFQR
ncbi:Uncharacterised protein [Salmonella enterica subsp. enterica serovar Bovismorbificans]|uniref:Uncharacterized protein n=1 Tax=Salmonella enterica subsp. enterica serovar Bovismorbificans TaxID=58097 RepID=A0A655EBI1_SALET|nr:Uncharacterised protein [Salmonella enterica subsp. enterica serovar Bovismorbificans]CNV14551.1 Uncharacterised protein [Salmonella enterica subsp. enterica serovar Bovismorbificans]